MRRMCSAVRRRMALPHRPRLHRVWLCLAWQYSVWQYSVRSEDSSPEPKQQERESVQAFVMDRPLVPAHTREQP